MCLEVGEWSGAVVMERPERQAGASPGLVAHVGYSGSYGSILSSGVTCPNLHLPVLVLAAVWRRDWRAREGK